MSTYLPFLLAVFFLHWRYLKCEIQPVDVALLLDTSEVIQEDIPLYKSAVKSFIRDIHTNQKENKIAIITFDTDPHIALFLTDGEFTDKALQAADQIEFSSVERNTHLALSAVTDKIFVAENGDRQNVTDTVILVTTGESFLSFKTVTEANRLKHANITLFVLGVGEKVNDAEIQFLSTKPASYYSDRVHTFGELRATLSEMASRQRRVGEEAKVLECPPLFDIAFIIDASTSISGNDFKKEKDFVNKLISSFDISPKTVRASLIAMDMNSRIIFNMKTYTSYSPMKAAIMSVDRTGHGRVLDKALRFCRNSILKKVRFDESGIPIPQVLVVITSGKTRYVKKVLREAEMLKRNGVAIFTISVGKRKREYMSRISSSPVTTYNYNILTFNDLDKVYANMVNSTCKELGIATEKTVEENFDYGITLPKQECHGKSDLVFYFQVPPKPEDFNELRTFMQTLIRYLSIGEDQIRLSILAEKNGVIPITTFQQNANKNDSLTALDFFRLNSSVSRSNRQIFGFKTETGWREEVPKIIVMFCYGTSNGFTPRLMMDLVEISNRQDILRCVVNLGDASPQILNSLASEPQASHIIFAPFVDNLMVSAPYLLDKICDESTPANHVLIW